MDVELIVFNPNEDREISFGVYQFVHGDCEPMRERYVQATDEYASVRLRARNLHTAFWSCR